MSKEQSRVVIVGASAAGPRCASRLRRLQPDRPITVVEQAQEFSVAACGLPYVLSGDISDPLALRRTNDDALRDVGYFADVKGVQVLAGRRATRVDVAGRQLHVVGPDGEAQIPWDELVLATGARARRLPGQPAHPRVHVLHTLADLAPLSAGLSKGTISSAIIVGAGLVGCEAAEAFAAMWGVEVTLVESEPAPLPQVLDPEVGTLVARELERNDVRVRCGAAVEQIAAADQGVEVAVGGKTLKADVALVALGVEPAVDLAISAGAALGQTGAIAVDARLATSVPHVWAAGDCVEVPHAVSGAAAYLPLGSLANRQGRTLANVLAGREDTLAPAVGAVACKVFELNVAAAGLGRRACPALGLRARSVWITTPDRAHYWPESKEIFLHLVYAPDSGRVLGLQAVGQGEVAKRVDATTQLLARGVALAELTRLEHAYAPPYAPALDPVAVAAHVALNQEDGVEALSPDTDLTRQRVLDVRHLDEQQARPCGAGEVTALPQEALRGRVAEVAGFDGVVVCERGTRSAEVVRLLGGGRYLGGGLHWRNALAAAQE